MATAPLPVIRVLERPHRLYVFLPPGQPDLVAAFHSHLQGRRRCWNPRLRHYSLPGHLASALRHWLEGQQGVMVEWPQGEEGAPRG